MDAEPYGGNTYKRPAYAVTELLNEVNGAHPGRSKTADGIVGDYAHSQRSSGHNPNAAGIVCALDITHDPTRCPGDVIAEALRSGRDARLLYVIWDRRIFDGAEGASPWSWHPYNGSDPHTGHVHISLRQSSRYYDNRAPWGIGDDMPLSDTDLAKIKTVCEQVWAEKNFVAPGEAKATGPTYRDSALRHIWAIGVRIEQKIDAFLAKK